MKEELIRRLLKFLSVKIFIFTTMVILAIKGVNHWYFDRLLLLSGAFFGARTVQYIVNAPALKKKGMIENIASQADEIIEKVDNNSKPLIIKLLLNLLKGGL